MSNFSFFWHDYETWGANPRSDRAAQFAGLRTDAELNPVGDPVMLYCAPSDDLLPSPDACLVTGITPQRARDEGLREADFFGAVHEQLAMPGTCGVGYNTIRFDDEVTRFGLYRNFIDPYAREWQNGNSRWDVIDMVRLTRALRPEGIEWPIREDGAPSFRLEELTKANGIAHEGAHDALVDVRATIALARLVRQRQPRLYEFVFLNRLKKQAAQLLDLREHGLMLHVSRRIPAALGCISPIVALADHPTNSNSVICFDLRHDPAPLLMLEADELRERLYTPTLDLAKDEQRIGLKEIHLNKCPVLVPVKTLTSVAAKEWAIDMDLAESRRTRLISTVGLEAKLSDLYRDNAYGPEPDPEKALYEGFLSPEDRRRCDRVRQATPDQLAKLNPDFRDARLPTLLFRYRARNWPDTLSAGERKEWDHWRQAKYRQGGLGEPTLPDYRARLADLRGAAKSEVLSLLNALDAWPGEIGLDSD